ncbi:hypothetical protein ACFL5K_02610 [Gemmatimonadota bacterium]
MADELELENISIIGDLQKGRPTLGNMVSVSVYRLVFYSLQAAHGAKLGKKEAGKVEYLGGVLAGKTLYNNFLESESSELEFFQNLEKLFFTTWNSQI